MADAPQTTLPPLISNNLGSAARLTLTALAGLLVQRGILTNDETTAFVTIGSGILIAFVSFVWVFVQNKVQAKKIVAAAATGNPFADIKAPSTQAAIAAALADPTSPITAKEPS